MLIICPTCRGKGTINDRSISGPIMYCDKRGNNWPQVKCQSCGGSGWCEDGTQVKRAPVAPQECDEDCPAEGSAT